MPVYSASTLAGLVSMVLFGLLLSISPITASEITRARMLPRIHRSASKSFPFSDSIHAILHLINR